MPVLAITRSVQNGTTFTQAQNETQCSDVETFLNTTRIDSTNIQSGGLATANYATGSVDTAALGSSAVTTVKIADAAVTQAKRASLGYQLSSSSGAFSTTNATPTDVTNLSVTGVVATGRPVFVAIVSDGAGSSSQFAADGSPVSAVDAQVLFIRGATEIARYGISTQVPSGSGNMYAYVPGSLFCIDVPAAGTYTYKVQIQRAAAGTTALLNNVKLIAFEL